MEITSVVFDFGNVISLPQPGDTMEVLAALAGMDPETMGRLYWELRHEYDQGTSTGKQYYRKILSNAGVSLGEEKIEEMIRIDTESWCGINAETVKLMENIRGAGLKLGILSNMPQEFLDMARSKLPVLSMPDEAVFSCEVDAVKPGRKIYEILIEKMDAPPESLVFFDDLDVNVKGAEAAGIRAFLWKNPESARRELQKLGIDL
ncbi:HAD family hydrolase [Breznakiella homolactica]|uniref:HAD family phosphatase n=1 Tax=Breznakiella homolactica TaxID=2798577 RepID=A0A7T8B881_9SPIR|nr:HAD family phosphatase [Breznakiella homolactica]QQO08299.1 HAD family phosphatase [Breznakiella homolactica]